MAPACGVDSSDARTVVVLVVDVIGSVSPADATIAMPAHNAGIKAIQR
jgi:hypothetical protein